MDFYEVLEKRSSVRKYTDQTISDKVLNKIGKAVQLAPSACNKQPWKFLIIFDQATKDKICKCYSRGWLAQSPAIVVALGNNEEAWKREGTTPITDIDVAIAMEHLVLAASAEGLGTCWICAYEKAELNKALEINQPWDVIAISPLGYPAEGAIKHIPKKNIEDIFEVSK